MRSVKLLLAWLLIAIIPIQGLAASLERVWHPAHMHVTASVQHPLPNAHHHHHAHHAAQAHAPSRHAGGHAHPPADASVVYLADFELAALKGEAIKRFLDVILEPGVFAVLRTPRNAPVESGYWVGCQHSSAPPERPPRICTVSAKHG